MFYLQQKKTHAVSTKSLRTATTNARLHARHASGPTVKSALLTAEKAASASMVTWNMTTGLAYLLTSVVSCPLRTFSSETAGIYSQFSTSFKFLAQPQCNADEEFRRCGTACEETCENYGESRRVCTKQCVVGCFCKKGLVRAEDGTCVKPDKCREYIALMVYWFCSF